MPSSIPAPDPRTLSLTATQERVLKQLLEQEIEKRHPYGSVERCAIVPLDAHAREILQDILDQLT